MSRTWTGLIVLSSLIVSAPAFAQGSGCQERRGAVCGSGRVARLTAAGASVSRGGDFKPVAAETGLRAGDRVLLGTESARLALGGACTTTLRPGSLATITREGDLTCVTEFGEPSAGALPLSPGPSGLAVGASLGALALIGAGIGLAVTNSGGGFRNVSAQ